VNTYITYPKDNKTPEKAIVFLTDIFGIFPNSQLLADEFAKSGYLTVIPDLFQGDQISVADMESGKANLGAWLPNHQTANVDPVVEASIKYVRETLGVKKVGAVGYCFGAKVCFYDAIDINLYI
jgi:dienelactone hydrolase